MELQIILSHFRHGDMKGVEQLYSVLYSDDGDEEVFLGCLCHFSDYLNLGFVVIYITNMPYKCIIVSLRRCEIPCVHGCQSCITMPLKPKNASANFITRMPKKCSKGSLDQSFVINRIIVICVIQPWNIPFWCHSCTLTSSDLSYQNHNFIVMLKLRYNIWML